MNDNEFSPGFVGNRFFSIEGIDGSGKSTQIKLLSNALSEMGFEVVLLREPGGCAVSEQIRSILLNTDNHSMCSTTELLLYWAARAQLVDEIIRPALSEGKVVIADRFGWSSFAYQGYGRGFEFSVLHSLKQLTCNNSWPVHSFLLDIPAKVMKERLKKLDTEPDRMEEETIPFFEKIKNGYLTIAQTYPSEFTVLDGTLPIEDIQKEIIEKVTALIQAKQSVNL